MFSGIVETIGKISSLEEMNNCIIAAIEAPDYFSDLKVGDSISVNGVCLTIVAFLDSIFTVTIVPETARTTNLKKLTVGDIVNLERSVKMSDRIGGHMVQGHIDEIGKIIDIVHEGKNALLLKIAISNALSKYIVDKGFIAIDGMSITVIKAESDYFTIALIPHTQATTIAKNYSLDTTVNLEVDMISKYVEKIMESKK